MAESISRLRGLWEWRDREPISSLRARAVSQAFNNRGNNSKHLHSTYLVPGTFLSTAILSTVYSSRNPLTPHEVGVFLHMGNWGTEMIWLVRDHTTSRWPPVVWPAFLIDQDDCSGDMIYGLSGRNLLGQKYVHNALWDSYLSVWSQTDKNFIWVK